MLSTHLLKSNKISHPPDRCGKSRCWLNRTQAQVFPASSPQVRHWCPVLFTEDSRFTLCTCERVWRRKENAMLPATSFSMTSLVVGQWWSEEACVEGHTDLYWQGNGSLTAIRYRDKILEPTVRTYAGAVGPGFVLHDNARLHVARVRRQYLEDEGIDAIEWCSQSLDLNPIEPLFDIMFRSIRRHHVAPQTLQELGDALTQTREDIPQDVICRLIRSMSRHCQACIQAHGGHTRYWEAFWVAGIKFWQNELACHIIISLWFLGCLYN